MVVAHDDLRAALIETDLPVDVYLLAFEGANVADLAQVPAEDDR
jgi:hypothetical protein